MLAALVLLPTENSHTLADRSLWNIAKLIWNDELRNEFSTSASRLD